MSSAENENMNNDKESTKVETKDFIRTMIDEHNKSGRFEQKVHTRFPPEPNGYLHIGHAKAICIDFGIAEEYGGVCNLRFDDTNPTREETKYADAIIRDIKWLGFDWDDRLYHASDYFGQLYEYALVLIKKGVAYVDDLTADEIREYRGTLIKSGKESPYRNRSVEENLELFEKMKNGEFEDGTKTLRAKIDMAHGNMNMRDPVMYRILRATHHRTGDDWCMYPTYDWTHGQSDSIENITHSLCDLGFEDHRPLYDWFLDQLEVHHPQQIEFARLNISYTITSKRKLRRLIEEGHVKNWDDPRMPTLSGLRRRGFTSNSVRNFIGKLGVSKKRDSVADIALLEHCLREELNKSANRLMAVLKPLKVVITNYPDDQIEEFEAVNNPEDKSAGMRKVYFSKEIYIEKTDFMEVPPNRKYFRLSPGAEVRLKHTYYITCDEVIKDDDGNIIELRCTYDPESRGGSSPDGRRVKGTLHWVSAHDAVDAEVRLYNHLFSKENPEEDEDFTQNICPDSVEIVNGSKVEPSLRNLGQGENCQFLRHGYFCLDSEDSTNEKLIFNRSVTLKDSWAKIKKQ